MITLSVTMIKPMSDKNLQVQTMNLKNEKRKEKLFSSPDKDLLKKQTNKQTKNSTSYSSSSRFGFRIIIPTARRFSREPLLAKHEIPDDRLRRLHDGGQVIITTLC